MKSFVAVPFFGTLLTMGVFVVGFESIVSGGESVPWVESWFERFEPPVASRLQLVEVRSVPELQRHVRAIAKFNFRNPQGKDAVGEAKLFLPKKLERGGSWPVYFSAGYEIADKDAPAILESLASYDEHAIILSPCNLGKTNPLIRTVTADTALLHILRSLPNIDDARVAIGGTSAGGYLTLELAAETLPLAGAAPDVPPVNLGFNAALFTRQSDIIKAPAGGNGIAPVPALATVLPIMEELTAVIGEDHDGPTWAAYSPLARLDEITCPVSIWWSTADILVPMGEVGAEWTPEFEAKRFPEGLTLEPAPLMKSREGRLRFTDVLQREFYAVSVVDAKEATVRSPYQPEKTFVDFPDQSEKQWTVNILDEGPVSPFCIHTKDLALTWGRTAFLKRIGGSRIEASQLNEAKLERLMTRYAGIDARGTKLSSLDYPESERADVIRGLKLYVSQGKAHAERFKELYTRLPKGKQALGPLAEAIQFVRAER